MPDFSKWGIGPDDVAGGSAPVTRSLDEGDFSSKWLGTTQPATPEQPAPTPKTFTEKLMETWPVRLAKTLASAATLPGDVYAGKTAVDINDPAFLSRATTLGSVVGGGAIPSVYGASKPLIEPATASLASLARDTYGIPIRGGQISESPSINYLDAVLKTKPFSGYGKNVSEQHGAFNREVAKAIGEDADKVTPEVMANAKTRLGQNYEDIAANTTLKLDDSLGKDFMRIAEDASSVLAPNERSIIHSQLGNILDKAKGAGEIDGKTFQTILRTGSPLDRATKSADSNVRYYAGQIKQALLDGMGRHAPEDMQSLLKSTNSQYKAMKTIEDLVEKSPTGDISPALLMGAVRKSYPNMAYGGGGRLADLARIGQKFLKDMPQSGTQPRLSAAQMLGLGGGALAEGGLAYFDPVTAAKVAALGLTAAVTKGAVNKGVGSLLRSDFYANRLINSALPAGAARQPNMLQKLTASDIPYIPPAIPQITIPVRPGYYDQATP